MILIDKKPLNIFEALNDTKHPMHVFAQEYNDGVKELKDKYGEFIKFIRPGYPRYVKGYTSTGKEIPQMPEPTPPMRIPLKAYAQSPNGKHLWACCLDEPTVLPNGLWDLGRTKSISINEDIVIDIDRDIDKAFFLYFKSPLHNPKAGKRGDGQLKVYDPNELARELGEQENLIAERKMAVWKLLTDEKLPMMARAYGINQVDKKQFPILRQELERQLETNDSLRKHNPAVKGTKEFIDEMKVTDGVLLRNFVKKMLDEKRLECSQTGIFKIGDKLVIQVPANNLKNTFDFLCQYLSVGNNKEKLQEFMKDLLYPEYLDTIIEKKEWEWLAKVADINTVFKKTEELKTQVRNYFCPATE